MNAKVTISKTSGSDGEKMEFNIIDGASGETIVRLRMEMLDYAHCITGLAFQSAEIIRIVGEDNIHKLGKKKITKSVGIELPSGMYEKSKIKETLLVKLKDLPEMISGEWEVWDYGLNTRKTSDTHKVVLCKYVEET
jgi:hypothetical protein